MEIEDCGALGVRTKASETRVEKKFGAVAMMRSIRDEISAQIEGMTLEEETLLTRIPGGQGSFSQSAARQGSPTGPRQRTAQRVDEAHCPQVARRAAALAMIASINSAIRSR